MQIVNAPSKAMWMMLTGLHHLPLIKSVIEKTETIRLVKLAQSSIERKQNFNILGSGWARKKVRNNTKNVLSLLAGMDRLTESFFRERNVKARAQLKSEIYIKVC
ncbi:MAG: hypothetical protein ABSD92_05175 [Candidatus Bathyarchaeia archaeon]